MHSLEIPWVAAGCSETPGVSRSGFWGSRWDLQKMLWSIQQRKLHGHVFKPVLYFSAGNYIGYSGLKGSPEPFLGWDVIMKAIFWAFTLQLSRAVGQKQNHRIQKGKVSIFSNFPKIINWKVRYLFCLWQMLVPSYWTSRLNVLPSLSQSC